MKNLVTGASGFIGSHIVEVLKKKNEKIVALVRRTSDTAFLKSIGVELRYGDLNDKESLRENMKDCDKVYHSAALANEWISKEESRRVNVEGTKNLLDIAKEADVKRFVFISSLAVLGMRDHHGTPADSPYKKTGDSYIDTKIDSERMVFDYYKIYGLPVVVVRPGFVFGPRDYKLMPRILTRLQKGKFMFIGSGKNKTDLIYIENLTNAIVSAGKLDQAIGQAYNVTNNSDIDIEGFIYKISDLWNIKKPSRHLPKPMALFLCGAFEGWTRLTRSKKPPYITKTSMKFLTLNLEFDIKKTKEQLGYNPTVSIEEGLKRTKQWMDSTK